MRIGAGAIGVIAIPILIVVSIGVPTITVFPTIGTATIRWFSAFSANEMNQSALLVVTTLGL